MLVYSIQKSTVFIQRSFDFTTTFSIYLSSDHEFIEEQERHLFAICIRTMALPLGR